MSQWNGAPHPGPGGGAPFGQRRCRLMQTRDGRTFGQDELTGETFEILQGSGPPMPMNYGAPPMDLYGADPDADADDFLGGEDEDDDELGRANREASEFLGSAEYVSRDEFGAREERLEKKLNKLNRRVGELRQKKVELRGPFKERRANRIQRRIDKHVEEMREIRAKMDKANEKRNRSATAAAASVATAAAIAAGAAPGGVAMGGSAPTNRDALTSQINPALLDPQTAQMLRDLQAKAGQRGTFQSPAGSGRLVPLPFYASGSVNPRNALTVPAPPTLTATTVTTEQISWAKLKVVGFTTTMYGTNTANTDMGLVSDLKTKGSANLFVHENAAPASDYDSARPAFTGLRTYPVLQSPNQATVDLFATGTVDHVVYLACSLVCDVLSDDVFGVGMPGAYA